MYSNEYLKWRNESMKKVYILFESDAWHTWDSMNANTIVGITTSEEGLRNLITDRIENGWADVLEDFTDEFDSVEDFTEFVLRDFENNRLQTQSVAEYLDIEFYAMEADLDTVII